MKKIRKIIKPILDIIFSQSGKWYDEKEGKKFQSRIPFILNPGKKIPENIEKKFKKLKKPLSDIIFSQNWVR